jgi:hypothetical protein
MFSFYLSLVYLMMLSVAQTSRHQMVGLCNNKLESTWKLGVVVYFVVLSQGMPGVTEENPKNLTQNSWCVGQSRTYLNMKQEDCNVWLYSIAFILCILFHVKLQHSVILLKFIITRLIFIYTSISVSVCLISISDK